MIVAIWAAIGKAALKVLSYLATEKKGRKCLAYTAGIIVFIVLFPFITAYGLFGYLTNTGSDILLNCNSVYDNLPFEIQVKLSENEMQFKKIDEAFKNHGLSDADASKAKLIYLSYLTDKSSEDDFYERLSLCFLMQDEENSLSTIISREFQVEIKESDTIYFSR